MTVLELLNRTVTPPRRSARRFEYHYECVLGTSLELQLHAADARCARRAERAVLAEVDRLAAIVSTYNETSEFARWQETFDAGIPVSRELADLLEWAECWRIRTAGAFNPAVKSLVDLLQRTGETPECTRLVEQLILDGIRPLWQVDRQSGRARRLTRCVVTLDAIAKGYIVSAAALRGLETLGITEVLLNIGGDVQHYGASDIRVGITNPFAPTENADPIAVVRIRDQALATSGGYRRQIVIAGRSRSHLIDPRTGRSADFVRSASVIAPDCTTADVLSTAFSVLQPNESIAMADGMAGVACLLVLADGSVITNARWARHTVTSQLVAKSLKRNQ